MSFHFSREGGKPAENVTVWPGDTNNDRTVNEIDMLPIASYWLRHGPARYNYSGINGSGWWSEHRRVIRWWYANLWSARTVPVWNNSEATYVDANGDGFVNESDTTTIIWTLDKMTTTNPKINMRQGRRSRFPSSFSATGSDSRGRHRELF
ncbi:MAG: dockerin type I domain-containing protein, partial [bacterium]